MRRRTTLMAGLRLGALLPAAAGLRPRPALAQAGFPNRPIRLVIPAGVGGGTDILARLVAPGAAAALGTPVVIENRGGGESLIGTELVVRSPPDGHVLLFSDTSPYLARVLRSRMPFDPLTDLLPVMRVAVGSIILYAHPGSGIRDLGGLVARAKAQPGGISYGTSSTGSHLLGELLRMRAGIDLVHVPYRSGGLALNDVLSGHVPLTFNGASNGKGFVQSGELVAVGSAGEVRNPSLPDVPTFAEQGFPGFPAGSEWGLFAPAGTPAAVLDTVEAAFRQATFDPGLAGRLGELGFSPDGTRGAAYAEEMARAMRLWGEVAAAAGMVQQ
ncbi:Bug family tripartite tricarboxylate transporter substrate binding protein [Roseomonas sp. BN140053]|uniref:Bug family tripartite tricarboxylate transporter substrate binding protein n=1 Tax=Roseomonas sp. BN140053 TaxID=3391898 RepID=UPI0039E8DD66